MVSIKISPRAQKDMLEIKEYISEELCNPTAANNVLSIITKRIRELAEFPLMGAPLSSVIDFETGYRFLVCGQYTAFYRYEVRLRVILALLEKDLLTGVSIQEQEYLSGLDARLRGASVGAGFVWDPLIQPGFPEVEYWYLYRALISPKGGKNG